MRLRGVPGRQCLGAALLAEEAGTLCASIRNCRPGGGTGGCDIGGDARPQRRLARWCWHRADAVEGSCDGGPSAGAHSGVGARPTGWAQPTSRGRTGWPHAAAISQTVADADTAAGWRRPGKGRSHAGPGRRRPWLAGDGFRRNALACALGHVRAGLADACSALGARRRRSATHAARVWLQTQRLLVAGRAGPAAPQPMGVGR